MNDSVTHASRPTPASLIMMLSVILIFLCVCLLCGCVQIESATGLPSIQSHEKVSELPDSSREAGSVGIVTPGKAVQRNVQPDNSSTLLPEGISTGVVTYADPIPPTIAYHWSQRNLLQAGEPLPGSFDDPTAPFFQGIYLLSWNSTALLAKPSSPLFVIEFTVDAGSMNPNDSLVLVTVRDHTTQEMVAEDGFNGKYSSESAKRIVIRKEGEYHVNLYGYGAAVSLVLKEGIQEGIRIPVDAPLSEEETKPPDPTIDEPTRYETFMDAGALTDQGTVLFQAGNSQGALAFFTRAVAVDPEFIPARVNRGIALLSLARDRDAVLAFDIALERDPGNAEVWMYRGDALAGTWETEEAVASYRKAVTLDPGLDAAWVKLGDCLASLGRGDEAIEAWRQGEALRPGDAMLREKISTAASEQGNPGLPVLALAVACVCFGAGGAAVLWMRRRSPSSSPDRNERNTKGRNLLPFLGPKKKNRSPRIALSNPPPDHPAKKPSGTARIAGIKASIGHLLGKGNPDRDSGPIAMKPPALTYPDVSSPANPLEMRDGEIFAADSSTRNSDQNGSPEMIIAGFNRILSGPEPEPAGFRGIACYAMGRYAESLKEFDREIEHGKASSGIWTLKATVLVHLGRNEEALASCEKALELNPASFNVLKQYGDLLCQAARNSDAIRAYDRALSMNPHSAATWASRGRVLRLLGRPLESRQSYERSLAIDPGSAECWLQEERAFVEEQFESQGVPVPGSKWTEVENRLHGAGITDRDGSRIPRHGGSEGKVGNRP